MVFEELQDVLGQFPFQSPSVFNFYLADFNLPEPDLSEVQQKVESGGKEKKARGGLDGCSCFSWLFWVESITFGLPIQIDLPLGMMFEGECREQ